MLPTPRHFTAGHVRLGGTGVDPHAVHRNPAYGLALARTLADGSGVITGRGVFDGTGDGV